MGSRLGSSYRISLATGTTFPTGADEAVADDAHGPDLPLGNVPAEPDRLDSAAMEHARQRRLRSWQRLP